MVGDPPRGVELVGRPSQWSESGRETHRRCGTGREILLEVRKWLGDSVGGSEVVRDPPGGPELVERYSRWSGTGRRPFLRSGSGRETLL